MTETTWTPTTIALSKLKPWERNPKRISKAHAARLLDLWERLGQFQTIAIGPGGEVYDGHQRLSVLKAAHGGKYEVTALQSSRALSEHEREELTVAAHVGTVGQFDWDALSGWDAAQLQEWGMDGELLADWRTDIAAISAMLSVDVVGVDVDDEATRSTNNLSLIGKGENVGFQFGDIMVTLPRELYDRMWLYVDNPALPDRRTGVMQILEAGLVEDRTD